MQGSVVRYGLEKIEMWCNGSTQHFDCCSPSSSLGISTKTSRGRLEMAPARSHKPNDAGSSPAPATKRLSKVRGMI